MGIGYFDLRHHNLTLADHPYSKDLRFMNTLDIDYLVDSLIEVAT